MEGVPLTEGALLAEESTLDPLSPLPSFLELILIDNTSSSGKNALKAALKAAVNATDDDTSSRSDGPMTYIHRLKAQLLASLHRLLSKYGDEMCALLTYVVEKKMLHSSSCATVSESVYGMKRTKVVAQSSPIGSNEYVLEPLSDRDKTRSALISAFAPYIKDKLDNSFENMKQRQERDNFEEEMNSSVEPSSVVIRESSTTTSSMYNFLNAITNGRMRVWARIKWKRRIRDLFIRIYPYLHMTHEGTMLAYQWAYLFGFSAYYSPSWHAVGLILRRITMEDLQQQKKKVSGESPPVSLSPSIASSSRKNTRMQSVINAARITAVGTVSVLLVTGWLISLRREIQRRRRRLITESGNARTTGNAIFSSIPPPAPPVPSPTTATVNLPSDKTLCPLCNQTRVNPAASPSGYVFCYRCIVLHLREHKCCPLTGIPCQETGIVRLFETVI